MEFEWDPEKADSNLEKHRVSFDEAATTFGDPLSLTISDPDHSDDEDRFILLGEPSPVASSSSSTPNATRGSESSALDSLGETRGVRMKTTEPDNGDMREEYDFTDGDRGKYAARFAEGSNVVVLDPDVAAAFKTRKAVNDALRAQLEKRRSVSGGDG